MVQKPKKNKIIHRSGQHLFVFFLDEREERAKITLLQKQNQSQKSLSTKHEERKMKKKQVLIKTIN